MTPQPCHLILSYNKPQLTEKCLQSLLALLPSGAAVLLVHNGSNSEVFTELKQSFPQISHLYLPSNRGYSGGANWGLRQAFEISPWVFFHTNDTETFSLPQELPMTAGLYGPKIFKRKTQEIDSLGGKLELASLKPFHCKKPNEFEQTLISYQKGDHTFAPYIPGTAFLIHQDVFSLLQGFDETYHTYWEDIDLSYRFLNQLPQWDTLKMGLVEAWQLRHGIGKTCHKKPFYTQELFPRNKKLFAQKHGLSIPGQASLA